MSSRRDRRTTASEPKIKKGAKVQLVLMLISIILMVFSITQVYYLARYTFGLEVEQKHLSVYRWVTMLLN